MTRKEIEEKLLSLPSSWETFLEEEKDQNYFSSLISKVSFAYEEEVVYPPLENVYEAFKYVAPNQVKAVIIGQDPYFNPGQADGLCFSVPKGCDLSPSLLNIYKELQNEYGYPIPKHNGDLTPWARQGVLLLNASLTVKQGVPNSHSLYGWQTFTDHVIEYLDSLSYPIVYLLWGNFAKKKGEKIQNPEAGIIKTSHPSPLGANKGFLGSNCFKLANQYLKERNIPEINWQIQDI